MNKVLLAVIAALMTIGFTSCNEQEEGGRPPLSRWARKGSENFRETKHLKRTDYDRMRDCDCNEDCTE